MVVVNELLIASACSVWHARTALSTMVETDRNTHAIKGGTNMETGIIVFGCPIWDTPPELAERPGMLLAGQDCRERSELAYMKMNLYCTYMEAAENISWYSIRNTAI